MKNLWSSLVLAGIFLAGQTALADNIFTKDQKSIKSGYGEEFTVKNGFHKKKDVVIKDRLGDKYEKKVGVFGGEETEINLLGNQVKKKKGFSGELTEATSIFGDKIVIKKGRNGRTQVSDWDLSGITSIVQGIMSSHSKGGLTSQESKVGDPGIADDILQQFRAGESPTLVTPPADAVDLGKQGGVPPTSF